MQTADFRQKRQPGGPRNTRPESRAVVGSDGRIILPPEVAGRYGLRPGTELWVGEMGDGLKLSLPASYLAKVYVEPTNRCNLECRTCMRNEWSEPLGQMEESTFSRILESLRFFSPLPTVFLGGFGEPLVHPRIIEMVADLKRLGSPVELITNGTLLTRQMSKNLIEAGLDRLWVSLDGARPESYADVRLGAALPEIIHHLTEFRDLCILYPSRPQLGVVFVAMKRNIADLPDVLSLGTQLGVQRFLVTHVLPYTAEMRYEILYSRALGDFVYGATLELPKLDMNEETREPVCRALRSGKNVIFAGGRPGGNSDSCPFIESGSTSVGWDGNLSPCLALLHSHTNYLDGRERFSRKYVVGNVRETDLQGLWNQPDYLALRERVKIFDFAPCSLCGGCHLAEKNEEDCFGNPFPTCGGCLWAQGVIRCP
jgi:MoaA/NifB/PqqE/SkfB family radical SAM enzyme